MTSAYGDLDRPPLQVAALTRALVRPGGLWTSLRVVAETVSTNADVAAAALTAGQPEGLVVVAESQTGGRGRQGRLWVSPPRAGLTFSILLRPALPRDGWSWLPLLAGLSVARAVQRVGEVKTGVKWPNDVLAGPSRRKLAGVLGEVVADVVVLGVGVNVSTRREELPGDAATSLLLEGATCTDRAPLLVMILRLLAEDYRDWLGGADVRASYLEHCSTVGRAVLASLPGGGEVTGTAADVDAAGRLIVVGADGTRTALAAGDVTHVR